MSSSGPYATCGTAAASAASAAGRVFGRQLCGAHADEAGRPSHANGHQGSPRRPVPLARRSLPPLGAAFVLQQFRDLGKVEER